MSATPGERAAGKQRLAQRGWPALNAVGVRGEGLEQGQQVEGEQDAQKCRLGGEELVQAKIVRSQIGL
jgi:hypothetical protein